MHSDQHNDSPLLSIIMPVYNAEKYVAQAIQSIIDQTYKNWELLICDDGSSDDSWSAIKQFDGVDSRVFVSRNENNLGKVKTVNGFIEKCKGKYLTIHDADDWSDSNRLGKQIEFLESKLELIGCGTNYVSWGEIVKFSSNLNLDFESIKNGLLVKSQIHGPTLVFRRCSLLKIGNIYRDFFDGYNEDYDLCVRLAAYGELVNLSESLYHYRITPSSLSRSITPKKKSLPFVVKYLAKQRFDKGYDDLDINKFSAIDEIIYNTNLIYQTDKSLIIREQSEYDFYNGFFLKSLKGSFLALRIDPFNFQNWRLIQHLLRKKIFRM